MFYVIEFTGQTLPSHSNTVSKDLLYIYDYVTIMMFVSYNCSCAYTFDE